MRRSLVAAIAAVSVAGVIIVPLGSGSSHREAPGTSLDPSADNTDTYAFVSPDAPGKVTFIGNWIPGETPNAGPTFFRFDDKAFYYINVDNVGDGKAHIRYLFKFKTHYRNPGSALYAIPPVNNFNDATLNQYQTYTVTQEKFATGNPAVNKPDSSKVLASDVQVAPQYAGPKTMPNYAGLASTAISGVSNGGKVFAGPRTESFFIDLGATFDSINLRMGTGNQGGGKDDIGNTNIMTIALQVPQTDVTRDGQAVSGPAAANAVIGNWDSTERQQIVVSTKKVKIKVNRKTKKKATTKKGKKTDTAHDARKKFKRVKVIQVRQVQVSRLGNPLVNELLVGLPKKDLFNATQPKDDVKNFGAEVLAPEPARILNALFKVNAPETNRTDIVQALLTGIPGKTQIGTNPVAADTLKLNMGVPPTTTPNRFGVIGGDLAGFPNGRRLGDDVVDITLQVVAGFLTGNKVPLGDGVDQNPTPFSTTFPYLAAPISGFDAGLKAVPTQPPHPPVPAGGG